MPACIALQCYNAVRLSLHHVQLLLELVEKGHFPELSATSYTTVSTCPTRVG